MSNSRTNRGSSSIENSLPLEVRGPQTENQRRSGLDLRRAARKQALYTKSPARTHFPMNPMGRAALAEAYGTFLRTINALGQS